MKHTQTNATFRKPSNLKISQELYTILGQGFDTFFAHFVNQGKEAEVNETILRAIDSERVRWSLYWAIDGDLRYDDSHPRYIDGVDYRTGDKIPARTRRVPYSERYSQLSKSEHLKSNQLDNALKAIFKEFKADI